MTTTYTFDVFAARMDSDLDIVVLTDTDAHSDAQLWTQLIDGQVIRLRQWGPADRQYVGLVS